MCAANPRRLRRTARVARIRAAGLLPSPPLADACDIERRSPSIAASGTGIVQGRTLQGFDMPLGCRSRRTRRARRGSYRASRRHVGGHSESCDHRIGAVTTRGVRSRRVSDDAKRVLRTGRAGARTSRKNRPVNPRTPLPCGSWRTIGRCTQASGPGRPERLPESPPKRGDRQCTPWPSWRRRSPMAEAHVARRTNRSAETTPRRAGIDRGRPESRRFPRDRQRS